MKIAELRNHPFILLVLKDGESEGFFSPEFMHKTKQQLSDMSLRIASDNLSIIYADQLKKACEVVLGICNLGLLELCDNNSELAKKIIKEQSIVYCFRSGWAKYTALKKISPSYFDEIKLTTYALATNDTSDIRLKHAKLVNDGYRSVKLLEIYKNIAASYSANAVVIDNDEDILKFELQKFLNTAVSLLLIDTDKKIFTSILYENLISYITDTENSVLIAKLNDVIVHFIKQLPVTTKTYLQEIELLQFTELKDIIHHQSNVSIFIQEILELPLTLTNELNDDFDGGYNFNDDDDDEDFAYLKENFFK